MQRRFQASVSRPKHDLDTSEMFSRWNFRFELVWVCRLVLTTEGAPWQNCCCVRQSTNLLFAHVCTVLFRYVAWLAFKTNAPQGKCSFDHRSNCWSAPIAPNVDDSWNQARCLIISVTDKELVESYQFRCSSLFFLVMVGLKEASWMGIQWCSVTPLVLYPLVYSISLSADCTQRMFSQSKHMSSITGSFGSSVTTSKSWLSNLDVKYVWHGTPGKGIIRCQETKLSGELCHYRQWQPLGQQSLSVHHEFSQVDNDRPTFVGPEAAGDMAVRPILFCSRQNQPCG